MTAPRPVLRAWLLVLLLLGAACAAPAAEPAPEAPQPAPAPAQPPSAVLSPRDTARAEIAGARILVDYGRPSMRGRTIMGELVPFGRVWRTGANAATTLVTEAELEIGGEQLPRGTYTLYTLPSADQWLLIINRQTGQWGTEYDQSQDLARIPMQRSELPRDVEQFTISVEPVGEDRGTLVMAWERTQVQLPFRVRGTAR
jgi:hypothetical protein